VAGVLKETVMLVKFLRPVGGMAYFDGDVADIGSAVAATLIAQGYAIMIPDTETVGENALPDDLPYRTKLWEEAYTSLKDVERANPEELAGIKGIGKKGAEKILKYFEK
jgi:hypothetical protein